MPGNIACRRPRYANGTAWSAMLSLADWHMSLSKRTSGMLLQRFDGCTGAGSEGASRRHGVAKSLPPARLGDAHLSGMSANAALLLRALRMDMLCQRARVC